MNDFLDIFSSKAKIKILRALYFQSKAISLRHVAVISNSSLFSVQIVLKEFLKMKIVKKTIIGKFTLFEINKKNILYDLIAQLFISEMKIKLELESKNYTKKAETSLEFSNSCNGFFRTITL